MSRALIEEFQERMGEEIPNQELRNYVYGLIEYVNLLEQVVMHTDTLLNQLDDMNGTRNKLLDVLSATCLV